MDPAHPPAQHLPYPAAPPIYEGPPQPRRTGFGRVAGAAAIWAAPVWFVLTAIALIVSPDPAYAIGGVFGLVVFPYLVTSLVVWLICRTSRPHFLLLVLITLAAQLVLLFMAGAGRMVGHS
ncbi:hypothetical protein D5S17_14350 [Pseudonocardiaceae bacterium YIM PH 21723]|nr:hypothetical protein D5S17_14350 [Pseudonocardiaceae bacterium YIM PH 21723]